MEAILTVNGMNILPYIIMDGIQQTMIVRRSREIVTMGGTKRRVVITKRGLTLNLLKTKAEDIQEIERAFSGEYVTVTYIDRELGIRTADFFVTDASSITHESRGGNTFLTGTTYVLEEV